MIEEKVSQEEEKTLLQILETCKGQIDLSTSSVIEVGCGLGWLGRLLSSHVKSYAGFDPFRAAIYSAMGINSTFSEKYSNVSFGFGSAETIAGGDDTYDLMIYNNSWYCLQNHKDAIVESYYALNDDGLLLVLEPNGFTTQWEDPSLCRGDPLFNEGRYKKVLDQIKDASRTLYFSQEYFERIKMEFSAELDKNIHLLRKRKELDE